MIDAKKIVAERNAHLALRQLHEPVMEECYAYSHPIRGNGLNGSQITNAVAAAQAAGRIMDSTATDGCTTLASNLHGGMTPANALWLGITVGNDTDEDQEWLDAAARTIWENIHNSNFDAVGFESCLDSVEAGWFVMYIDEDREDGGFHFEQWPLSQCCISSSKSGGKIDTVYRTYTMTAEQAVNEFGKGSLHDSILRAAESSPSDRFEFVHCIKPRSAYVADARLAKNMRFASYHVDAKNGITVRESGYHEFPCAVPRWHKIPDSDYAVGKMYEALADVRTLNSFLKLEYSAADIAVGGMWIAEDDGVINARTMKLGARKVVIAASVDSMKALESGSDFNVSFSKSDQLRASIRHTLMADQLGPQDGPTKTATEIHARVALIRQMLGPIYGRFQSEYLQPLIERCFGIAYRAGALGVAPQSLRNRNFTVKFLSPLARAQQMEEVQAIDAYVAGTAGLAQFDAEIMDTIDLDAAQRFKAKALGVPAECVPSKRDVDRKRKQRAEARAKQQQDAQTQQMQLAATETALKRPVAA